MRFLSIPIFGLVLLLFSCILQARSMERAIDPADKILLVKVDETGIVTDGRDTINVDDLAYYIRERLFKNYMGTGKMYDKIKLQKLSEDIPVPVMEVLLKEINNGQKAALTEFCLFKYKKLFDSLDKKHQDKIKKQFPVLFQADYM